MVIDTSAILAILLDEPEADDFVRLVEADPIRLVSAVGRVEATFVIEGRKGEAGRFRLERFFELVAEIVAMTAEQAEAACDAFRQYGKCRHPANLNFGDVFAYALAKTTGEPLLFQRQRFQPDGPHVRRRRSVRKCDDTEMPGSDIVSGTAYRTSRRRRGLRVPAFVPEFSR